MTIEIAPYAGRRAKLQSRMQNGIAVIPTAPETMRNGGTHYPYRFDSHFYYLTGFDEPEAVLVLIAGDAPQSILFCREKTWKAKYGMASATAPMPRFRPLNRGGSAPSRGAERSVRTPAETRSGPS